MGSANYPNFYLKKEKTIPFLGPIAQSVRAVDS
jgi:hypothetical protein